MIDMTSDFKDLIQPSIGNVRIIDDMLDVGKFMGGAVVVCREQLFENFLSGAILHDIIMGYMAPWIRREGFRLK